MADYLDRDESLRQLIDDATADSDLRFESAEEIEAMLDDASGAELAESQVRRILRAARSAAVPTPANRPVGATPVSRPVGATTQNSAKSVGTSHGGAIVAAALLLSISALIAVTALRGPTDEVTKKRGPAGGQPLSPFPVNYDSHSVGLTAKPREAAAPLMSAEVGQQLTTGTGQRLQVVLPDGSHAYLNQNTVATVESARHVKLARGELFVEVEPQLADATAARFVVQTADRQVTALGTKFAVRADDGKTDVLVTQGKVAVSGFRQNVFAGQQLRLRGAARGEVAPLPRMSDELDWLRELIAEAESPLVPASEHGGGSLIAVDPEGQEHKLSLRKYHVDVHIEDGFARTTIDQTYFNHKTWRMEGTFYFPLPADGSLSRLAMYVGEKRMEGGMAERNHARNVFEEIVHTKKDPALLEWVDGSTFKMRVFPLEGRQEKRIIISYTQRLPAAYGRTKYRFPAGHNLGTVGQWSVNMRVKNGGQLKWMSDSHEMTAVKEGGDLLLKSSAEEVELEDDIVVQFGAKRQSDKATANFATTVHEGHRYLMVRYRPELPGKAKREKRHWVFLFESSGDRNPLLARVQVDAAKSLLANAEHDDTFTIVTAGTRVGVFNSKPLKCSPDNVAKAVEFLNGVHLIGALDLEQALTVCDVMLDKGDNAHLVHLGSAIPALGQRDIPKLVKQLSEDARYIGVAIGKRWSRQFMKDAASRTGGYYTQINPDEEVSWRAFELLSSLNAPRLLDVAAKDDRGVRRFLNFDESVEQGEEVCAIARFPLDEKLPKSVTITGQLDGKPFEQVVPVADVHDNADYLPRSWAKLEIDRLLTLGGEERRDEIVALSKAMYVMSPYTSLLVLETEDMYVRYNVDRGRKDHWALYPCPDKIKVVHQPLIGPQLQQEPAEPVAEDKPSVSDVLETILIRRSRLFSISRGRLLAPSAHYYYYGQDARVVKALSEPINWSFVETPLADVIEHIEDQSGFNIHLDNESLVQVGVASDDPITRKLDDISLRSGLRLLLDDLDLVGVVQNGQLTITSQEAAADLVSRVYPVGDLAMPSYAWPIHQYGFNTDEDYDSVAYQNIFLNMVPPNDSTSGRIIPSFHRPWGIPTTNLATSYRNGNTLLDIPHVRLWNGQSSFDVVPWVGERPILYPSADVWEELTLKRQKYRSIDLSVVPLTIDGIPLVDGTVRFLPSGANELTIDKFVLQRLASLDIPATNGTMIRRLHLDLVGQLPDPLIWDIDGNVNSFVVNGRWHGQEFWKMNAFFRQSRGLGGPRTRRDAGLVNLDYLGEPEGSFFLELYVPGLSGPLQADSLTYQRPEFIPTRATFTDLLGYAPGMNPLAADQQAVIANEVEGAQPKVGAIDDAARKLIEAAQQQGWRQVTLRGEKNESKLVVHYNGRGQYRYERRTLHGLIEIVACNGDDLWHLYPELGIGARRKVSRFHRADFRRLVPWMLPSAEDLAHGCDVKAIDERTVAIVPHPPEDAGAESKSASAHELHLVFSDDGGLAERRVIEQPAAKVLSRVIYDADGTIRWLDADGEEVGKRELPTSPSKPAEVNPDLKQFVVLPMPLRSLGVPGDFDLGGLAADKVFSDDDAWHLVGPQLMQRDGGLTDFVRDRFFARGDHRLGLYTLLLSNGYLEPPSDGEDDPKAGRTLKSGVDPMKHHPNSPLARYFDSQVRFAIDGVRQTMLLVPGPRDGFLQQLDELHRLQLGRQSAAAKKEDRVGKSDGETHFGSDELLSFAKRSRSPIFAWMALRPLMVSQNKDNQQKLAEAYTDFSRRWPGNYAARYEHARALAGAGKTAEAATAFAKLYRETRQTQIPPIDEQFVVVLRSQKMWSELMRESRRTLLDDEDPYAAMSLVWQCDRVGARKTAQEILDSVMAGNLSDDPLPIILHAVEYLRHTESYAKANELITPLLTDEQFAKDRGVWQLAMSLAELEGNLEQTLDRRWVLTGMIYDEATGEIDVNQLRTDFGALVSGYENLAAQLAESGEETPADFVSGVIRAADRWRAMDPDATQACRLAASVLQKVGETDLAWDYLTTPLAQSPNEAGPWLALAQALADPDQNAIDLASRAYAIAFEAESTNAQILYDHATLLQNQGQSEKAKQLWRRLAEGEWQPRFRGLSDSARRQLEGLNADSDM